MKKVVSLLMIFVLIFALAGCGASKASTTEITKNKKLTKANVGSYLKIDIKFDSVTTNYSDYDGTDEKYAGGRWKWATGKATITVSNKTTNDILFKDCEVSVVADLGIFGSKNFLVTLDEDGNYTETVTLQTNKDGIPKEGFTSTDYAVPVATYEIKTVSGNIEIHIKLDENGSVIPNTSSEG